MMKNVIISALCALMGLGAVAANPATTVKHPEWSRNAVIYEANIRQATPEGTFRAFERQIPRLKDLGVDIIWMMPVYPISFNGRKGRLGSYYSVADYKGVNPEFGSIDDFKSLVKTAHDAGMKVILDWVPNHTGQDNAWVRDYPERYDRNEKGEMFGPFDWTDVYQLNYNNPDTRRATIDALQYWLREGDVDGFRCDVAGMVATDYWDEARKQLETVKPEVFMLAEADKAELTANAFDMDYHWPMKDLFSEIAATSGQYSYKDKDGNVKQFPLKRAVAIDSMLAEDARKYPADAYRMQMITNHDLNSWEGTEFERLGNLSQAFAVLSYTLPGMPLIYTGQEVGLDRAFEFFDKDTAPDYTQGQEYTAFYKQLNALKHDNAALRAGDGGAVQRYVTKSPDVYVFERQRGDDRVLVAVNLGATAQKVQYAGKKPAVKGLHNIFGGDDLIPKTLEPGQYVVLASK